MFLHGLCLEGIFNPEFSFQTAWGCEQPGQERDPPAIGRDLELGVLKIPLEVENVWNEDWLHGILWCMCCVKHCPPVFYKTQFISIMLTQ